MGYPISKYEAFPLLQILLSALLWPGLCVPSALLAQGQPSPGTPDSNPASQKDSLSKKAVLLKVPFEKQKEPNLCGIAAIDMITSYYGQKLNDTQYYYLKLDAKQTDGITGATMEVVLRASDYYTAIFKGTLDRGLTGLYRNLDLKRPLIVMVASVDGKVRHYAVVTGYDPQKKLVFISDPAGVENEFFPVDQFEAGWARTDYFTLLAVPKSKETSTPIR
jgi:ABC-type bacteriocin/lantibiotic exporter with double-glycine peptidase domain